MKSIFKKLVIIGASIISTSAFADPFSSEWNWQNDKLVGAVKEITMLNTKTKKASSVSYYSKDSLKTKEVSLDKNGKADYITTLEYDAKKRLSKIKLNKEGKKEPLWIETATYNAKNLIEQVVRKQGNETSKSKEFKYDKNGLSEITIAMGSRSMTWYFKFSKDKNLMESSMSADGTTRGKATYEYDKHNNPIKIKSVYGKYSRIIKISYQYDKVGNWIQKTNKTTAYKDGKISGKPYSYTAERKIIYYSK